jgi:hypothetical protein
VLSEDQNLTPEGAVTGIDWRQHFEEYREYLDHDEVVDGSEPE